MKEEQIKIALLAIIAGTLIIQTVMQSGSGDSPFEEEIASTVGTTVTPQIASAPAISNQITVDNKPAIPVTSMKFEKESFDFGNIKQNTTDNIYIFKFTNTGDKPLIIENAKGSCGCTVPIWPKEPILPGGTGEIKVDYKPAKQKGTQRKTVTVTANTEPKDTRITITAFVEEVEE